MNDESFGPVACDRLPHVLHGAEDQVELPDQVDRSLTDRLVGEIDTVGRDRVSSFGDLHERILDRGSAGSQASSVLRPPPEVGGYSSGQS